MITIVSYGVSLAQLHEVDIHRERVSHFKKNFHELIQGDIQVPMKKKDITTFVN